MLPTSGISEFISFENSARQIVVIEMVKGKYSVYTGGLILGISHAVITVSLDEGSNQLKPNLVVSIQGLQTQLELFNTGSSFSWNK